MTLGNHLYTARKKSGLSQEDVAAKLGVSRQTISKWELDETLPDIRQAKRLAVLYLSLIHIFIRQAALLHDVGKIGISEAILNKTGKLTEEEYETIKGHVEASIGIIRLSLIHI